MLFAGQGLHFLPGYDSVSMDRHLQHLSGRTRERARPSRAAQAAAFSAFFKPSTSMRSITGGAASNSGACAISA